jgi:hypothetical protein
MTGYGIPTIVKSHLPMKIICRQGSLIVPEVDNALPPHTIDNALPPHTIKGLLMQLLGMGWDERQDRHCAECPITWSVPCGACDEGFSVKRTHSFSIAPE